MKDNREHSGDIRTARELSTRSSGARCRPEYGDGTAFHRLQFRPAQDWTHGPYYGTRGTYFADVTGDGKADAIAVNQDTVTVRP